MVVLREGMCPGLDADLVRDLRAADIKTVEDVVSSDIEDLAQRCSVSYKVFIIDWYLYTCCSFTFTGP
ncbi:hypothetical protein CgunFtcFv8_002576 [Champsocephalus gunnari]|uniref:RAD51D N-terminal domain-containing protein n=1 Tax=Champsocephalus gunnari TaxID=52237 RepID=A0AAN8D8Y7_CHAGU|nr:hypothetical protein CgunFtcFv8_002576 [Champsocephalus gunnari]